MKLSCIALALALSLTACKQDAATHAVRSASVEQVDRWIAANECTAVDANNPGTRERMGVVPGAIKLSSHDKYDVGELPDDKSRRLIFYCANTQCGASHDAAARALTAGYTAVEVMPDGIAGWVSAGKKVDKI